LSALRRRLGQGYGEPCLATKVKAIWDACDLARWPPNLLCAHARRHGVGRAARPQGPHSSPGARRGARMARSYLLSPTPPHPHPRSRAWLGGASEAWRVFSMTSVVAFAPLSSLDLDGGPGLRGAIAAVWDAGRPTLRPCTTPNRSPCARASARGGHLDYTDIFRRDRHRSRAAARPSIPQVAAQVSGGWPIAARSRRMPLSPSRGCAEPMAQLRH